MVCTFFGHKDANLEIENELRSIIIDLIENHNVKVFYVGHQGNFDYLVRQNLEELCKIYTYIQYWIVLAYMPNQNHFLEQKYLSKTIYPDGLEKVPPKFAINRRNRWMIGKANYVVTHVKHNLSNASKFKEIAEREGKIVINIT